MYENRYPFDKNKAFALIEAFGGKSAIVHYSGGNDEGGVEDVRIVADQINVEVGFYDIPEEEIVCHIDYQWGEAYDPVTRRTVKHELTERQQQQNELMELLENLVSQKWGSFAGEFYVNGVIALDVASGRVKRTDEVETPRSEMEYEEI